MKTTTKFIAAAVTAFALFLGTNVNAQTTERSAWRLGIGLEGGIPTGDANNTHGFELGGTARLQYGVSDNVALTLTSGYYNFFGKEFQLNNATVKAKNFGVVPVKLGIKSFFTDNLYVGAEAGVGFTTGLPTSQTKLLLSPAVGWADQSWDFGVRYENFSGQSNNWGLVGLRIAYGFPL